MAHVPTKNEVVTWHDLEWPSPNGDPAEVERVFMKLAEEVGELGGAIVKHLQGRTDEDWLKEAFKEGGDVMIVMNVLSDRLQRLFAERAVETGDPRYPEVTPDFMLRDRWWGPMPGQGVRDRKGASYRL